MGLTLIRKSDGAPRKRRPKIALVLAGGAVSGGAFKVGGLKALDDYLVDRKVVDLDMYLGLSAGSMLAVSLASGVTPDEMVKVLEGTSGRLDQLTPLHFYNPNVREFVERPAKFAYDLFTYVPGVLWELLRQVPRMPEVLGPQLRSFLDKPSYTSAEELAMATILADGVPIRFTGEDVERGHAIRRHVDEVPVVGVDPCGQLGRPRHGPVLPGAGEQLLVLERSHARGDADPPRAQGGVAVAPQVEGRGRLGPHGPRLPPGAILRKHDAGWRAVSRCLEAARGRLKPTRHRIATTASSSSSQTSGGRASSRPRARHRT